MPRSQAWPDIGTPHVVDDAHQVITAADVTDCASDALSYTPMLDQCAANTGIHPGQALVDAGYCSETNLHAAARRQAEHGTETFMATGRLAHDEQVPPAPRGRIPASATPKQRMARKLRTKPGRAAHRRRKAIIEPVTLAGVLPATAEPAAARMRASIPCRTNSHVNASDRISERYGGVPDQIGTTPGPCMLEYS
jgi:hypothetical protein